MSRTRSAVALFTIAAASAGVTATAAAASPRATAATTNGIHTRAQVPWSQVGNGWTAAAVTKNGHNNLVLVSPAGQSYQVATLGATEMLLHVSHDGKHVLTAYSAKGSVVQRYRVWDLRSGKVSTTLPGDVQPLGFTRPTGSAVNALAGDNSFQRFTVAGHRELRVPNRPGVMIDVPHPGGLLDAASDGAGRAVTLYDHVSMRPIRTYAMPKGGHGCMPTGWLNASTLLETCTLKTIGDLSQTEVYRQNIKGGAPQPLTVGGWPGDTARPFPQGFADLDNTAVGPVATPNDLSVDGRAAWVYRMKVGRVVGSIKPPLATDVAKGIDNATVVGNTVFYTGTLPVGERIGSVASYDLKTKKVVYLAGPHSQYGGRATSSTVIDSTY